MNADFGCAINCIDGRAQIPVIEWVKFHGSVKNVDVITEPGADGVIARGLLDEKYIISRLGVAIRAHSPPIVAVCGHYDCLANPVSPAEHIEDIRVAADKVVSWGIQVRVVGLYVNEYGTIDLISDSRSGFEEMRSYL